MPGNAPADPLQYVHASSLSKIIDDPGPYAEPEPGHTWANTVAGTVIHDVLCERERRQYVDIDEAWDAELDRLALSPQFTGGQDRELALRRIAKHIDATPRPGSLSFGSPLILTEVSFRFHDAVAGAWFAGTVDVLMIWPTGRVLMIDYKTGDVFPDLLLNPQLVLYPLAGLDALWTCKAKYVDHWHGLDWSACDDWFKLPTAFGRPELQIWYTPEFLAQREAHQQGRDWPMNRTGIYSIPRPPIENARNYLRAVYDVWRRRKAPLYVTADPDDLFGGDPFDGPDPFGSGDPFDE